MRPHLLRPHLLRLHLLRPLLHFFQGRLEVTVISFWTHPTLWTGNRAQRFLGKPHKLMGIAGFPSYANPEAIAILISYPANAAIWDFYTISWVNIHLLQPLSCGCLSVLHIIFDNLVEKRASCLITILFSAG